MSHDRPMATRPEHPEVVALPDVVAWLRATYGEVEVADPGGALAGVRVTGISLSSQRVQPGDLYAALPGARAHGIGFLSDALAAGAVAVLTDAAGLRQATEAGPSTLTVPVLVVADPRRVLGRLAAHLHGEPARAMRMIGVTGTQGKTTTTRLAEGGLGRAGVRAAVIGTVGTRVDGEDIATTLTTPEAPDLQGLFAMMRERGVAACAMEVSSHALVMGRVDGVVFDVGVFLNLGRDHLDFHRDVEDYFQAKAALFTPARARLGLVNIDDEHGRRLVTEAGIPVRTFSSQGAAADWRAVDVALRADGSSFTVQGPDGLSIAAGCPMPGDFNVANTLAAIAACSEAGLDPAAVAAGIAGGAGVPGRFEQVDEGQDFVVVVDYAHKPDAVAAALRTLRPLTEGRVIIVLGAGGDRDPGKRPIMAGIAADLADVLIVTDDNPRTEDPAAIRAAMLTGVDPATARAEVVEQGDRRLAIHDALRRARPGDIVLVAGKGHETGQKVHDVVHPFDDRAVVREALAARG